MASRARLAVRMARVCNEVWTTSGRMPASARSGPDALASALPSSERSASHHPVKRFSAFHVLWPCRSSTRVEVMAPEGSGPLPVRAPTTSTRRGSLLGSPAMVVTASEPVTAASPQDRQPARRWWRPSTSRVLLLVAVAVACAGVVGNVVQVARQGWVLEGDNAAIAINTFDTVHGHFRLVGPPTSAVNYAGIGTFYHPGPMLYWLAALPAGLFGWSAGGFLFFAAVVNCLALVGVAVFVRRRAGTTVATGFMAAAALLVWTVGNEAPHDIWNPHIAVLPWLLTLVLLWSVIDGDCVALVPLAFAASFILQDHFVYLPLVGPLLVGTAVVLGARWWRHRRGSAASDGDAGRRAWLVHGAAAAVVGAVCWAPVAIQQLTGETGNVSQLVRYVRADPPHGREGVAFAAGRFFGFFGSRPLWLSRHLDIFSILRDPSALDVVVGLAVVAVAAALCWYHLRRGRAVIGRLLALCLATMVLLVVSAASLPVDVLSSAAPYNYLPWWPVCILLFTGITWGAAAVVAVRTPRPRWRRPVQVVAVAAAVVLAVATVVSTHADDDRSTWAFPAIRQIDDQLRPRLPDSGPYYVVGRGGLAFLSLTNPIVLDLVRHGYQVRLPPDREEFLGTFRRVDRRDLAGIILVVSGADQPPPPPGSKELVRVPATPDHPATDDTATSYPVVVYLVPARELDRVR